MKVGVKDMVPLKLHQDLFGQMVKIMQHHNVDLNEVFKYPLQHCPGQPLVFFFLFHLFHNTLRRTYKTKLRHFQKQDSIFMQDKRFLQMLHRQIDILRYVFIIGGWLES